MNAAFSSMAFCFLSSGLRPRPLLYQLTDAAFREMRLQTQRPSCGTPKGIARLLAERRFTE